MFPPSTTRDKEQEEDGETEYQRRRKGCKLQKDYTLEHVSNTTPEGGGSIQEPRDQRLARYGMNRME